MRRFLSYGGLFVFGIFVFLFMSFRFLHFSTNTAKILLLKGEGGVRITMEEPAGDAEDVLFRLDATPVFNALFDRLAAASDRSLVDLDYDPVEGKGVIKEFRPDGTRLEIALSRYDEEGAHPHGLILGGDFPYGDSRRDENGSGLALHDGERWIHIWCTANEGIARSGGGEIYEPHRWRFVSSRIVEKTSRVVELASIHTLELEDKPIEIHRRLHFAAGENFLTLTTTVRNVGRTHLLFDYAYGDEPWIGNFGSSAGDIGWFEEGLVTRERHIDGARYSFAGYADLGNRDSGEPGDFTGYANYIQWVDTEPSEVYFSNDFFSVENRVLGSPDNRVLNVVWRNRYLKPGEEKRLTLRVGFVPPGADLFEVGREIAARSSIPRG